MSIYDDFREDENATIVIKSLGVATLDANNEPVYSSQVTIYSGSGIFYELSASEKLAKAQIQKTATGQVILDPLKVTTAITEVMDIYVTTTDETSKKYRMVTEKNPLNRNEAVIIDIIEN